MNFVEIKTVQGETLALNPAQIVQIFKTGENVIITLVTDRRIATRQFRNIREAVHYCQSTRIDTSSVGKLK